MEIMDDDDFLNSLSRLQSDRLDEQRCAIPRPMAENSTTETVYNVKKSPERKEPIDEVLNAGPPFPLVVLPVNGDYWQEGSNHTCQFDSKGKHLIIPIDPSDLIIEDDSSHCSYKHFFQNQEHYNFTGECSLGPLLLSTKYERNCVGTGEDEGEIVRAILRSSERTVQGAIATKELPSLAGPREIVKHLVPEMLEDFNELQFQPVIYPKASASITRFDEHGHAEKFKVGVIYQKSHQTHERQLFGNKSHSKAMYDFLQILGDEVELHGFKGYSGGLDTKNNQTGRKSVYTNFKGREIMFHVSTLLPYTPADPQQLQRKRHIGNDIIAIIFQDENTPFCPSSIRSSFLHIFIVVQVEAAYSKDTRYNITITAKEDVPEFGPSLPNPAVFSKNDPLLREFLLTKLLNGELAAFKARQFSTLMERTRKLLFEDLVSTLAKKSLEMLSPNPADSLSSSQGRGRLLSSLRNAFKSESFERTPEGTMRSRSLENLVDKEDKDDDDLDKTRKKKRSFNPGKRHSVIGDKQRRNFRPKPKNLFHAMSVDANMVKASESKTEDRVPSPTSALRDRSPSGSFSPPISPTADVPAASSIVRVQNLEQTLQPCVTNSRPAQGLHTFHLEETKLLETKVNGMNSSPKLQRSKALQLQDDHIDQLSNAETTAETTADVTAAKPKDEGEKESLVSQLRGDLYKLSREKAKLQKENETLQEDGKAIKDAMVKQAEDLCEAQYQLTLMRARAKQKGPLTASVV